MSIQKRIDERKCKFWLKQTCDIKLKENLMAKKYQFTEIDMCINCHANHEAQKIQEIVHEGIRLCHTEIKGTYALKQLCGCGCK